jgi:hypothetical protein
VRKLGGQLQAAAAAADSLLASYRDIAECCEEYFEAMDFRFLFNRQRKLFHIGYNIAAAKLDNNFYDLLASEARIASLVWSEYEPGDAEAEGLLERLDAILDAEADQDGFDQRDLELQIARLCQAIGYRPPAPLQPDDAPRASPRANAAFRSSA